MKKGFFLVLEGIDGSGKTTVADSLKKVFKKRGKNVIVTQEPTQEKIGAVIREYLINADNSNRDPVFEALAFAADRRWHVEKVIAPLLNKEYLVISDRYLYSSLAYQTINNLDFNWLLEINKYVIKPDLAVFLDVDPETALKRIKHSRNIFENKEFLRKVYLNYMEMVNKEMLIKINGKRDTYFIVKDIIKMIEERWR